MVPKPRMIVNILHWSIMIYIWKYEQSLASYLMNKKPSCFMVSSALATGQSARVELLARVESCRIRAQRLAGERGRRRRRRLSRLGKAWNLHWKAGFLNEATSGFGSFLGSWSVILRNITPGRGHCSRSWAWRREWIHGKISYLPSGNLR